MHLCCDRQASVTRLMAAHCPITPSPACLATLSRPPQLPILVHPIPGKPDPPHFPLCKMKRKYREKKGQLVYCQLCDTIRTLDKVLVLRIGTRNKETYWAIALTVEFCRVTNLEEKLQKGRPLQVVSFYGSLIMSAWSLLLQTTSSNVLLCIV